MAFDPEMLAKNMTKQWEYLIHEKAISPKALDNYGKEGWELVGFTRTTEDFTMIFKRPLSSANKQKAKSITDVL